MVSRTASGKIDHSFCVIRPMNLTEEKDKLILKLENYLNGKLSHAEISNIAWQTIDYFTKNKRDILPAEESFEREFWHAIWQIQHLADEEHWKDGTASRDLTKALSYLKGESMPQELTATRP